MLSIRDDVTDASSGRDATVFHFAAHIRPLTERTTLAADLHVQLGSRLLATTTAPAGRRTDRNTRPGGASGRPPSLARKPTCNATSLDSTCGTRWRRPPPPKKLEIFVLHDFHDLSCSNIARMLQNPLGAVIPRLHGARLQLRALARRRTASCLSSVDGLPMRRCCRDISTTRASKGTRNACMCTSSCHAMMEELQAVRSVTMTSTFTITHDHGWSEALRADASRFALGLS